jgi:hypothetical protein
MLGVNIIHSSCWEVIWDLFTENWPECTSSGLMLVSEMFSKENPLVGMLGGTEEEVLPES